VPRLRVSAVRRIVAGDQVSVVNAQMPPNALIAFRGGLLERRFVEGGVSSRWRCRLGRLGS
jgi:hypothetical protein